MPSDVLRHGKLAFPEDRTVVDVIGVQDGRVMTSVVQKASSNEIILTLPRVGQHPVSPEPGTRLELVWKDTEGLLAMLVEVVIREQGAEPVLRVRRMAQTAPGQRRGAVRSPLRLPVQVTRGQGSLSGLTVDISEAGLRCVLNLPDAKTDSGDGPVTQAADDSAVQKAAGQLAVGDRVTVVVTFDSAVVETTADVVRRHGPEDARMDVSLRFVGLPEVTQDLIRRHVFASLRDLRQRGLI